MAEPTRQASVECARWLANCLKGGWTKAELDMLERLWWEHHDDHGRLVRALGEQARPAKESE